MAVAIVIALLVLGTVIFHLVSPWWMTPLASNWGSIDNALIITLYICAVAFIVLNPFLALALWRYRSRAVHRAHYEPYNATLENRQKFCTWQGIAGMLAPAPIVWNEYVPVPAAVAVLVGIGQPVYWCYNI